MFSEGGEIARGATERDQRNKHGFLRDQGRIPKRNEGLKCSCRKRGV